MDYKLEAQSTGSSTEAAHDSIVMSEDGVKTDDTAAIINNEVNGTPSYGTDSVSVQQSAEGSTLMSRAHLPNTTTSSQSMMHLMKGMIGSGILALPSAIKNAGLWTGFIGVLIMGVIATHCMHQLVNCSHELCRRLGCLELSYSKALEQGFKTGPPHLRKYSRAAYLTINTFLCITQFGFCVVYVLFIAQNVEMVVSDLTTFRMPMQVYQLLVLVILIPLIFIRNLRALAPLSVLANILTVIGIFVIFSYCVQNLPPVSARPAFNSWATFPLFFGTAIYTFEGIGVVLPIENKMKYPQEFAGPFGVLNVSMVVTTCLCAGMGFFGYLKVGDQVHGSITLDLPKTAFYSTVKILFAGAILISYLIQFYVPFNIIWPYFEKKIPDHHRHRSYYYELAFRAAIVVITFVISIAVPHLDLMISLIGALASSAIALIFPPVLEMVVYYEDTGCCKWRLVKNLVIITIGFVGFIVGTITTIINIIDQW